MLADGDKIGRNDSAITSSLVDDDDDEDVVELSANAVPTAPMRCEAATTDVNFGVKYPKTHPSKCFLAFLELTPNVQMHEKIKILQTVFSSHREGCDVEILAALYITENNLKKFSTREKLVMMQSGEMLERNGCRYESTHLFSKRIRALPSLQ